MCVVDALDNYLAKTKTIRCSSRLIVKTVKTHHSVSKDTISRWLKYVPEKAGIDVSVYKGHSIHAAATSKAKTAGVPINIIMDKAGWTNANTFAKFYNKDVVNFSEFNSAILTTHTSN